MAEFTLQRLDAYAKKGAEVAAGSSLPKEAATLGAVAQPLTDADEKLLDFARETTQRKKPA